MAEAVRAVKWHRVRAGCYDAGKWRVSLAGCGSQSVQVWQLLERQRNGLFVLHTHFDTANRAKRYAENLTNAD